MTIQDTLNERQKTHGDYSVHAEITQRLKSVLRPYLAHEPTYVQEAADMIAHKLGRIVAGNALYADHWRDIAGYATLAEQRCEGEKEEDRLKELVERMQFEREFVRYYDEVIGGLILAGKKDSDEKMVYDALLEGARERLDKLKAEYSQHLEEIQSKDLHYPLKFKIRATSAEDRKTGRSDEFEPATVRDASTRDFHLSSLNKEKEEDHD